MLSISGSEAFTLIKELKLRYGVKQKTIADILGISRQAVTDMKAERRRFTKAMAEKLLKEFAGEPWANWLCGRLDALFTPTPPCFTMASCNDDNTAAEETAPSISTSPQVTRQTGLPVLTSPCRGDPELSPAYTRKYIVVPDELFMQTSELTDSYILIIDFDSHDGRLRRGDRVLALQNAERDCEIMVVEYRGALRLARRGKHARGSNRGAEGETGEMDWVLLDSGAVIPSSEAEATSCIVGIVMALL